MRNGVRKERNFMVGNDNKNKFILVIIYQIIDW